MSTSMSKHEMGPNDQYLDEAQAEIAQKTVTLGAIHFLSRSLEGKLLTLCEAVVTSPAQAKATKDLVRDALRTFRANMEEVSFANTDPVAIGVSTLDLEETEQGIAFPTMIESKA